VREAAPVIGMLGETAPTEPPSAPPEPVAATPPAPEPPPQAEAEAKPRRFGWWNRRG
jgi:hypothetical protein